METDTGVSLFTLGPISKEGGRGRGSEWSGWGWEGVAPDFLGSFSEDVHQPRGHFESLEIMKFRCCSVGLDWAADHGRGSVKGLKGSIALRLDQPRRISFPAQRTHGF